MRRCGLRWCPCKWLTPASTLDFQRFQDGISSVGTIRVPIIQPLRARAVVPTVSTAPSANAGTTLRAMSVNVKAGEWTTQYKPNPPKVTHAFLAMISE